MNRQIIPTALFLCLCCADSLRADQWTSADGLISVSPPIDYDTLPPDAKRPKGVIKNWWNEARTVELVVAGTLNSEKEPFDLDAFKALLARLMDGEVVKAGTTELRDYSLYQGVAKTDSAEGTIYYETLAITIGSKIYLVTAFAKGKEMFDSVPVRRFVDSIEVDELRVAELVRPSHSLNWLAIGIGLFFVLLLIAVLMYSASGKTGPTIEVEFPDYRDVPEE